MNSQRDGIYREIDAERIRQDRKWGGSDNDDAKLPRQWHNHFVAYSHWAALMADMGSVAKWRRRVMQIAAMAVALLESIDRRFPEAKDANTAAQSSEEKS